MCLDLSSILLDIFKIWLVVINTGFILNIIFFIVSVTIIIFLYVFGPHLLLQEVKSTFFRFVETLVAEIIVFVISNLCQIFRLFCATQPPVFLQNNPSLSNFESTMKAIYRTLDQFTPLIDLHIKFKSTRVCVGSIVNYYSSSFILKKPWYCGRKMFKRILIIWVDQRAQNAYTQKSF